MKIEKLLLLYIIYDFHNENIEYKQKITRIKKNMEKVKNVKDEEIYKCRLYFDNVKNKYIWNIENFFCKFKNFYNKNINNFDYILDLQEKKHLEYLIKINDNKQQKRKNKI